MNITSRVLGSFLKEPKIIPEGDSPQNPNSSISRFAHFLLLFSSEERENFHLYKIETSSLIERKVTQYEEKKIPLIKNLIFEIQTEIRALHDKKEFTNARISLLETHILEVLSASKLDLRTIDELNKLIRILRPLSVCQRIAKLWHPFNHTQNNPTKINFSCMSEMQNSPKPIPLFTDFNPRMHSHEKHHKESLFRRSSRDRFSLNNQVQLYNPENIIQKKIKKCIRMEVDSFFKKIENNFLIEERRLSFLKGSKELTGGFAESILDLTQQNKSTIEICQELKDRLQTTNKEIYSLDEEEFSCSIEKTMNGQSVKLPIERMPIHISQSLEFDAAIESFYEYSWGNNEKKIFTYIHIKEEMMSSLLAAIDALFLDKEVLGIIQACRSQSLIEESIIMPAEATNQKLLPLKSILKPTFQPFLRIQHSL